MTQRRTESPWKAEYDEIKCYSLKPKHYPKAKSIYEVGESAQKLLGLEIELELSTETEDRAWNEIFKIPYKYFPKRCFWKTDGSIRGYELILAPATLQYWYDSPLAECIAEMQEAGARGYESGRCGFHVHCDRRGYAVARRSPDERRLLRLLLKTADLWRLVSKRKDYGYCKIMADLGSYEYDRYAALNITPARTVEFRVFRGTTESSRLLASIAFCDAFLMWAKQADIEAKNSESITDFVRWISLDPDYDPLTEYLNTMKERLADILNKADPLSAEGINRIMGYVRMLTCAEVLARCWKIVDGSNSLSLVSNALRLRAYVELGMQESWRLEQDDIDRAFAAVYAAFDSLSRRWDALQGVARISGADSFGQVIRQEAQRLRETSTVL